MEVKQDDKRIKIKYTPGDYKIKTFGGDAVYKLEDALNRKLITPDDILLQAKQDAKYGICIDGLYSDGGSKEYCYYGDGSNQYTILKLNTLDGEKDLIIGMGGQILSSYNKNK